MQPVAPSVIDVNESIRGLMELLPRLIGEHVEIDCQPSSAPQPVFVDRSQLDQILANLVLNARDALVGISAGRISVRTSTEHLDADALRDRAELPPGEYVTITVSDNGHGMDSDTLAHIFEPFFTKKTVGTGTGLGLATVFGAITQNRGFIEVSSEVGWGSSFTVHLPRHTIEVPSPIAARSALSPDPPTHGTVLLVEDQADLLNVTSRMLQRCGVEVLAAQSPAEAMTLAEQHHERIAAIVTDVIMPGDNGPHLAQRITARYPHIKAVFMSGYPSDVIAQNGIVEQGTHFLRKPFSTEELRATLHAALSERT
jgi:CheY-like chemotaxis protein